MNSVIGKIHNRYFFEIIDRNKIIFSSLQHHYLANIPSTYQFAYESKQSSSELIDKKAYHLAAIQKKSQTVEESTAPVRVDISAEEMLLNHYHKILDSMDEQLQGAITREDKEKNGEQIKAIIGELSKVLKAVTEPEDRRKIKIVLIKFKKLLRGSGVILKPEPEHMSLTASSNPNLKKELMEDYGCKACKAIVAEYPDAYYDVWDDRIIISTFDAPLFLMGISPSLHVNRIVPMRREHTLSSTSFYQKYWKPIVEAVGGYMVDDYGVLLTPSKLPETPIDDQKINVRGWNTVNKKEANVSISFRKTSCGKTIWLFDEAQNIVTAQATSKYTEQDYANAIVKCTDGKLESIYNRTGQVIQVMPHDDFIEIDVDFGRGLGIVRLMESQLQIV